ncbi:insulin gene enhancer protein isl-2a-like [Boleophthalmus pectinirostris]|uniref:insulin gene enhancer protein isl-2a-like n=1 Tax=Boleophthalmus pectinirostris TaxID=150288 RepID=UPI00242A5949|nr:insulin gene enhancer protein isl-2a-like [Boleophthalmus pectinirostris]
MLDALLFTLYLGDMGDYPKQKSGVTLCVGCGSQILDQYILRVSPDLEWHAACLKCAQCGQYLDETCTCFVRNGKTYCKRDYIWLFGIKCAKCNNTVGSNDLVMRAHGNVYHTECFRCTICGRPLLPGDEFLIRDQELLCRPDHEATVEREESVSPGHVRHERPPLVRPPDPVPVRHTPLHRHHVHGSSEKSTRVRTVLNEKQLHTLRTCYNANPRPDALMKEQLVEMTGLSPRVIRVWFQNKRCKDKKRSLLLKQLQRPQQGELPSLQGLTGTLLTVTSPVHLQESSEGELVEHGHQPLWKSFNKFTQRAFKPKIFQVTLSDSQGSSSGSDASLCSDSHSSLLLSPGDT